eukprot:TRINITY_DN4871_c0_g1_i1.p1 TRINITY_DN4871_c0_g1~~TRINITY_DN4871_c0_g1_i1.p1  ORF type:complete len:409 (-),score=91.11 TRINITY_DN4871_c0_g1_i1:691-1917(-)
MGGVFAQNATELVEWLIDFYPTLYEKYDLVKARDPYLQRKLVGHERSVIGLLEYKNHVMSCDSNGELRIFNRLDYSLVRTITSGTKMYVSPILHKGYVYGVHIDRLKIWNADHIINPDRELDVHDLVLDGMIGGCCSVGEDVWVIGEKLSIINDQFEVQVLKEFSNLGRLATVIQVINDDVWLINQDNVIEIWDTTEKISKYKIEEVIDGHANHIKKCGNYVWITGETRGIGHIWIIDPENNTLKETLSKHGGEVYYVEQIGNSVWSVSWDCNIYSWDVETLAFKCEIPNLHVDAIQTLLSFIKEAGNGYQVWTGSCDRSINVLFVPNIDDRSVTALPSINSPVYHLPESTTSSKTGRKRSASMSPALNGTRKRRSLTARSSSTKKGRKRKTSGEKPVLEKRVSKFFR